MRALRLIGPVVVLPLVALGLASLVQSSAPTANAQLLDPSRFFGIVTVDGMVASTGTLTAMIGTTICGTASIDPGLGGGLNYDIQVKHNSQQTGCGSDGATVVLEYADGGAAIPCTPTGTWNNANPQQLNLTCTTPPTPTATATATPTPTATATTTPAAPPKTGGTPSDGDSLPLGLLVAGILGLAVVGFGAWALSRSRR